MYISKFDPFVSGPKEDNAQIVIPRISRAEISSLKLSELANTEFCHYTGSKTPCPPKLIVHEGPSLQSIQKISTSIYSALSADISWLVGILHPKETGNKIMN